MYGAARAAARLLLASIATVALAAPAASEELLRGIVKAVHQAQLSSDLVARVARVGFREGERFRSGDLLVELDCSRQQHELAALEATERETRVALAANQHLVRMGAGNRNEVEVAEARADRARAEAASMRARLVQCRVVAPFDGSVVELAINPHELPGSGRPFMVIAGAAPLEIEIIVPSRLLRRLGAGTELDFAVDETGDRHAIRILRTAGAIDGVSQTLKVYAGFARGATGVLPGMSGTARWPVQAREPGNASADPTP